MGVTVLLFSYGTLQKREVQMAQFGRELAGRADVLPGYGLRTVAVTDPGIAALTGQWELATVEAEPGESVAGMVFEITEEELLAADRYESAAGYGRIPVRLGSGEGAWAYARIAAGQPDVR